VRLVRDSLTADPRAHRRQAPRRSRLVVAVFTLMPTVASWGPEPGSLVTVGRSRAG
jgi:hypothetical protein